MLSIVHMVQENVPQVDPLLPEASSDSDPRGQKPPPLTTQLRITGVLEVPLVMVLCLVRPAPADQLHQSSGLPTQHQMQLRITGVLEVLLVMVLCLVRPAPCRPIAPILGPANPAPVADLCAAMPVPAQQLPGETGPTGSAGLMVTQFRAPSAGAQEPGRWGHAGALLYLDNNLAASQALSGLDNNPAAS